MRLMRIRLVVCAALLSAGSWVPADRTAAAQARVVPTAPIGAEEVFGFPFPSDLTAAARAPRVAWAVNAEGRRNVWVAEGPGYAARALTRYAVDDGQELTSLTLTPGGERVVYVRGGDHGSNWDDGLPVNPLALPLPSPVSVWSAPFVGGEPVLLGEGDFPAVSPRGDVVAFERDRHLWLAPVDGSRPAARLVAVSGSSGSAVWSPDGSRLAFVSNRGDHAFVGIYTDAQTPIVWLAPSTSRDSLPRWSPDGRRLVFVRRPGTGGPPEPMLTPRHAAWALWIGDAANGEARQVWKAPETLRGSMPGTDGGANLHWAARDRIVFLSYHGGWPQLYSLPAGGGSPLLLTPGAYMAEHIRLSPDGTQVVFAANTGGSPGDIDRRHVVRVPVDRAATEVVTAGTGLEWSPVITGSGDLLLISATAQRPPLPAVLGAGGRLRLIAEDTIPAAFPTTRLVTPRAVTYQAADGVTVQAQLFEPAPGGGKRPAVVYVHGGPQRQMLLGWHYSDYYARAYAANQLLASRGFVVLSINYRLGIGYGYEFHRPAGGGAQGAVEYQDVLGGATFLKSLANVDVARIGIYGGSYGGFLTALALGRNSDLFAAGVDIHGVHDFTAGGSGSGGAVQAALSLPGRSAPPDRDQAAELAWSSSPVSSVGTWRSPVLLIHGDEDRNVRFSQTVDLVQRLAAAKVPHEEIVIPDDTHHWMRHANVLKVYKATAAWFERHLASEGSQVRR